MLKILTGKGAGTFGGQSSSCLVLHHHLTFLALVDEHMAALIRQRINAVWSRHSATASDAPRPAHIAQTAALLLLVNRLETRVRAEAKDVAQPDISDKLASSRLDSDDSDEMPPAYTAQDPAAAPTSRTASQMWHGYLSRATARLELFRTEILPLAATTSAAPESHPWDLPLHLVPPLDVCIAWAAKIGETKKEAEAEWVSAGTMGSISLRAWRFPLEAIVSLSMMPGLVWRG